METGARLRSRRLVLLAALMGTMLVVVLTAASALASGGGGSANTQSHKVTFCHAAGLAGTTHFITLRTSRNGAAHHLDPDTGTPRAGHEQDYLGACRTQSPPPPPPGTNTGFLQICKEADGSSVTGNFDFTVAGRTVSVPVGACSLAIELPAGAARVTELPRQGFTLTGISAFPVTRLLEVDEATSSARVQIVAGDISTQTIVTFRNRAGPVPIELGILKICKAAGTGVTLGTRFQFTANGDPVTVRAGYCALAGAFPVGTDVTVAETVPAGMEVTNIEVAPTSRLRGTPNLQNANVTANVGTGVTEVTFTNRVTPTPPPQTGFLQVCKEADGSGVTGNFEFTVAGTAYSVPVGACTTAIQLPVGTAIVTETSRTGFEISGIGTIPTNRLVSANPLAGTATVTIVGGDISTQTIVIFRNRALPPPTAALTLCKVAGAGVLPGTMFAFTVAGHAVNVPAGGCVNAGVFTVGTNVLVDEAIPSGHEVTAISVNPPERIVGTANRATGTVTATVGTGGTTVTFTNARLLPIPPETGILKVCKLAGAGVATGTVFNFTVAGQPLTVAAGSCEQAGSFPVGTHVTVDEAIPSGHQVTQIQVAPATRLVGTPNLTTGTVTAAVGTGVTEVTFTNQRLQPLPGDGQVPICIPVVIGTTTIQVTIRDTGSGIQSIRVDRPPTSNVAVNIPQFTPGTTGTIVVTATRLSRSLPARLQLTVTDRAGNVIVCDPILTTLRVGKAQTFRALPQAEHLIKVKNGRPGIRSLLVVVNGKRFRIAAIRPGTTRRLSVLRAMRPGNRNTITVRATGPRGGTATVLVSD